MTAASRQNVIDIRSRDDPRVAQFMNVRDRDLRGDSGCFMAESESVVRRLLQIPGALRAILLTPTRFDALSDDLVRHAYCGEVLVAELDVMCEIAGFHIHRGVLALGERASVGPIALTELISFHTQRANGMVIAVEGLANVDNLGSIFRLASAFGVSGVLLSPDCCDPLYRKAVRASMGHVLQVPFTRAVAWPDALAEVRSVTGSMVIALESGRGGVPPWEVSFVDRSTVLLVGSESSGLRNASVEMADVTIEIPMAHGVPSINVSHSVAAVLAESSRQQRL